MKKFLFVLGFAALLTGLVVGQSLTIYCDDDPPFQEKGADGKLSGLMIEVVQQIQKRTGNTDPIQMVPWARGYDAIQTQPNVVLFSMTRTAARAPLFQWVGPVHETVFAFYSKADSPLKITSLDQAKKLGRIGVYAQDVRDQYLTAQGFTNLDRASDNMTNVKKLMAGRLDVYVSSESSLASEAKDAGFKPSDMKQIFPILAVQIYVALSKATPAATVKAWNDALDAMKKDGSFEKIYHKYLPQNPLPGPAQTPK